MGNKKPKVLQLAYGGMAPYVLKALVGKYEVVGIITPDKGISLYRSQKILPVEKLAKAHQIPIIPSNSFKKLEETVKKTKPDVVLIASYNKVIPHQILNLSKFINIHHGDLPRWRGRANVNWAIILGKKFVGLTFHQAAPDLDAGAIYAQFKIPIGTKDTVATIYQKINNLVETKSPQVINQVIKGYKGKKQTGKATYCITRLPEDGLIDWNQTTAEIDRLIRSLTQPYPGAFTYFNNRKLIIWQAEIPKKPRNYVTRIPGRVSLIHPHGVEVLTGDSSIIITQVSFNKKTQLANKIIKSVKTTLGINLVKLLAELNHEN